MERLQEEYVTPNGDKWQVWFVIYASDRYAQGGRDEILQFKCNGREVGHITRHLDAEGRLLQENYHGTTSVPSDGRRL
ncbi:MAG: hypothetical protein IT331_23190 [Anaerolineae bacterium]|nr:hypothetical protein [Anaerolineae bacterium]